MTHLSLRYPLSAMVWAALAIAICLHVALPVFYTFKDPGAVGLSLAAIFFDGLFLFALFLLSIQEEPVEKEGSYCHFCGSKKPLIERPASKAEQKEFHLDTVLECSQCHACYEGS